MTNSTQFSSGFELAHFLTSTGLLLKSWNSIHAATNPTVGERLFWKFHNDSDNKMIIIAFEATPVSNLQQELVPSSALKDKTFEFLCTEKSPLFSVNKAAVNLFYDNQQKLNELKLFYDNQQKLNQSQSRNTNPTPLIVTGQGLGGSAAILFTLSLLDSIGSGKNRPLCITFGSPLIGDKKLQQAISRSSTWNSCFLQVVSQKDPLPRSSIEKQTSASGVISYTTSYMPFGMFLFCSDANSTCFESPGSILELLNTMASIHDQNQGFQSAEYENIVQNLYRKSICKDLTACGQDMSGYSSLQASISLQLLALGLSPRMQQQELNNTLGEIMKNQRKKKFEPRALNNMKINMARIEWYKKVSKSQNIGYYDRHKMMSSTMDQDVVGYRRNLTQYWKRMVEEAEMKPQREGAAFRTGCLYAGTNYRRMVEPLDIAEYYTNGGKDYLTDRSKHYIQLETWLREGTSGSSSTGPKDVESLLTFDSCFWAHVEGALLSCEVVEDNISTATKKNEAKEKLLRFEEYVYGLLKSYEVSSEIFLGGSSYMTWWNTYKKIVGSGNNSKLASFMSTENYNVRYVRGTYNFS